MNIFIRESLKVGYKMSKLWDKSSESGLLGRWDRKTDLLFVFLCITFIFIF